MPITPFTSDQIPKYREAGLNEKFQNFIDQFVGLTIAEINALLATASTLLTPKFLTAAGTFTAGTTPEKTIQQYYISTAADQVINFPDADVLHNYSSFTDVIEGGASVSFPAQSIIDVWWEDVAGDTHAYIFMTFVGAGVGGGGGGGGTPVVPDYTVIDVGTIDYTVVDYG